MVAYVFWHRGTGARAPYEANLRAFHAALAADPPAGFLRSVAVRLDAAPWLPGEGGAYEDWYAVEGWGALGELNAGAVTGSRRAPHDAVAGLAEMGDGGIYAPVDAGELGRAFDAPVATWLDKPLGLPYAEWHERLAAEAAGGAVWQRQMVLGPAPEYVVLGAEPLDGAVVRRAVVTG